MSQTDPSDSIPVLLTSSIIAHDPSVKLKDTAARLHHALESIEQWLKIDPAIPLVFCDGSNFDLTQAVKDRFPGSKIECISFENDAAAVAKFGRGYGEGEIVKYALEKSKLIQAAGVFAKCTSKLWVQNFEKCKQSWNGRLLLKGVFHDVFSPFKKTHLSYIDTRFYIASCSVYRKFFLNAHLQLDPSKGHSLEEAFLETINKENLRHCLFPVAPIICGVGGGTGVYYKNPLKRVLKEELRLYLAMRSKRLTDFFGARQT